MSTPLNFFSGYATDIIVTFIFCCHMTAGSSDLDHVTTLVFKESLAFSRS